MARGKLTFKQTDVTRAIKAAVAAGVEVARVEIDRDGKNVIIIGKPGSESGEPNPWDKVFDELQPHGREKNDWDAE